MQAFEAVIDVADLLDEHVDGFGGPVRRAGGAVGQGLAAAKRRRSWLGHGPPRRVAGLGYVEVMCSRFLDDPPTEDHPYAVIANRIPLGAKVLDVGCSEGHLGAYFASKAKAIVDGIEPDEARAKAAQGRLRAVINATAGVDPPNPPYDVVLFIDVIEHIVDAAAALTWASHRARPATRRGRQLSIDGYICAMVPNAAHIGVRKKIALGDWSYADEGTFDRTHVHFYDTRTVGDLPPNGLQETWRWYWICTPKRWPLPQKWSGRHWPNLLAQHTVVEWRLQRVNQSAL